MKNDPHKLMLLNSGQIDNYTTKSVTEKITRMENEIAKLANTCHQAYYSHNYRTELGQQTIKNHKFTKQDLKSIKINLKLHINIITAYIHDLEISTKKGEHLDIIYRDVGKGIGLVKIILNRMNKSSDTALMKTGETILSSFNEEIITVEADMLSYEKRKRGYDLI